MLCYSFIWPGATLDDSNTKMESKALTKIVFFSFSFKTGLFTFKTIIHAHKHDNINLVSNLIMS